MLPNGQVEGRPPLTGLHPDRPGQVDPPMFAQASPSWPTAAPRHQLVSDPLSVEPSRHDRLRIARLDRLSALLGVGGDSSLVRRNC
jgi:hypothetical protein